MDSEMEKEISNQEVDPSELEKYMDLERFEDTVTLDDEKTFLTRRYVEIKKEYILLLNNKREIESAKIEDAKVKLIDLFESNYKSRKYVVRRLRELGETVNDKRVLDDK